MSTEHAAARSAVGRDQEVAQVVAALGQGGQQHHGGLVVTAERGMGRSWVAHRALDLLETEPLRLLGLPCQATGPYSSLVHALGPAAVRSPFGEALSRWLTVLAGAGTAAPPEVARDLLAGLAATAVPRPLVVLVDDAHVLDSHSQQVVTYLAHHGSGVGLACLLTAADSAQLSTFTLLPMLRLRPLDAEQLRVLLERHHGHPFPFRVARTLHRWSGGNPALALDLSRRLSEQERAGTSPVGLPLVPGPELVQRLGQDVSTLPPEQIEMLALFALQAVLPIELLTEPTGRHEAVLDILVAQQRLTVHQRIVEPCRRLDATVAWAALSPSSQSDLFLRLSAALQPSAAAKADYFAAQGGAAGADRRLVAGCGELYAAADHELAAAAGLLALRRGTADTAQDCSRLIQLLAGDGYVEAAAEQLTRAEREQRLSEAQWLSRTAELAAMTGDPSGVLAHVDVSSPPSEGRDDWLRAALLTCRVRLAFDGPDGAAAIRSLVPAAQAAGGETAALAEVVVAEHALHDQQPDAPDAMDSALRHWFELRPRGFDLPMVSAVMDLLALGRLGGARDLLAAPGSAPLAGLRTALLTLRIEVETAAGQFRRAAGLLVELDRERPNLTGTDVLTSSQAVRIGAVCDDLVQLRDIEHRLSRNRTGQLSYPGRRAHSAALGFRELVRGSYAAARSHLGLALQGPAFLTQGHTAVLADLLEATVADGDHDRAALLLARHSSWLPDRGGDRSASLLARCRALVAPREHVDEQFGRALDLLPTTYEVDRARTLLGYGRVLIRDGRSGTATAPLEEALALFSQSELPGWERHVRGLLTADRPAGDTVLPSATLTDMERRVLALVLQRKRNREIAATLFVSLRTVEGHLTRIFRKFGVSTKNELCRRLPTGPH